MLARVAFALAFLWVTDARADTSTARLQFSRGDAAVGCGDEAALRAGVTRRRRRRTVRRRGRASGLGPSLDPVGRGRQREMIVAYSVDPRDDVKISDGCCVGGEADASGALVSVLPALC